MIPDEEQSLRAGPLRPIAQMLVERYPVDGGELAFEVDEVTGPPDRFGGEVP